MPSTAATHRRAAACAMLPLAALALSGGLLSAPSAAAQVTADRAEALRHLVIHDCGSCHGITMKGGLGADLTPEALADVPPEALTSIILTGIPGTAMPAWRPLLSDADAAWIAGYLKGATQ